jgi:E3 ubiquitin-protein ligase ZNF598
MVEEHGADMSTRDKKDARRIQANFEFEEVGVGVGGRRGGHRDRGGREREREPPPQPASAAVSSNAAAAGSRRRAAFGGNLTSEAGNGSTSNVASNVPSRRQSPSPPADVDPAVAE